MMAPTPRHANAPAPSIAGVALVLGAGTLAVVLVLGLVGIAGPDGRTEVLDWITYVLLFTATGGSTVAAVQARRALGASRDIGDDMAAVKHQTNGALDDRIAGAIDEALRRAGVAATPDEVPDENDKAA